MSRTGPIYKIRMEISGFLGLGRVGWGMMQKQGGSFGGDENI
jgi:hypothetical protein